MIAVWKLNGHSWEYLIIAEIDATTMVINNDCNYFWWKTIVALIATVILIILFVFCHCCIYGKIVSSCKRFSTVSFKPCNIRVFLSTFLVQCYNYVKKGVLSGEIRRIVSMTVCL